MSSSTTVGFIPRCLNCLRDAGSIGFYFLECGHFICEACIQHVHSLPPQSALNNSSSTGNNNSIQCCPVCHTQCKAISLMDASNIPRNIYEFVSSKYRNVFQDSLTKMEEIIKFQHSHYEHVIRQLKSENQSLKETIQVLNQKKNYQQQIPNQYGPPLSNSVMILPSSDFNHQQDLNFDDQQNKGLSYRNPIMLENPMTTPYVQSSGRNNSVVNQGRMQQVQNTQRMSNGGADYQAASMSPLSTKSISSRMINNSTNFHQTREDFANISGNGRRSVTPLSNMRSASPKLPSVSPIRPSPNQNLNESLSIIMNQPPNSPSSYSDSMSKLSHNLRSSVGNENMDPKTPIKGKSLLLTKTPQPSSTNRSALQPRTVTTQNLQRQSPNNNLTNNAKGILPSSSRSTSEGVPSNTAALVENQANDLGLPNRSQQKDKPLLKRKTTTAPETPPLSSLGVQKQNKTLPSNTMDPTRTPLLSRKLISLSTPSRQRPQSSRGIPPPKL